MKELSDRGSRCYRRWLEGDESAAGEIMEELFFGLVYFVDSFVRDVHAAEDIAMDVISDLFVHRHRYDFRVSLKTYLYMRGKSRAIDHLRHRKALRIEPLDGAEDSACERDELEERLLVSERQRAVREAVDKLPKDMREAVWLVYFESLSYSEAARVMGVKPKQIDNLLYRAKKELRSILGEEARDLL